MKLVIVESPTKAKTLSRFLGKDYKIMASMGHVRDLPKSKISVDVDHNFKPNYELLPGKERVIRELKDGAKKSSQVILATDPDREGEAIAYHVGYILGDARNHFSESSLRDSDGKSDHKLSGPNANISSKDHFASPSKFARITFHEITKEAIDEALHHSGKINMALVHAQQARRILDRLVGYKLSPLLWSKVRRGLSAGRVQSVALRFIVEREKEIAKFKKEEFWTIEVELEPSDARNAFLVSSPRDTERQASNKVTGPNAHMTKNGCHASLKGIEKTHETGQTHQSSSSTFLASLFSKNGEKYDETKTLELFAGPYKYQTSKIKSQKEADAIIKDLKKQKFIIEAVEEKEVKRQPSPPFITSTLQQAANNVFGYSTKKTMMLAQRLYEEGFITYHRTDSFALAGSAITRFRSWIKAKYGEKYLEPQPRVFKTHSKVAQEAHEAIRPTKVDIEVAQVERELGRDEAKLYELIFKKAVATQMAAARLSQTSVEIKAGQYMLKSSGLRTLFDGFLRLYPTRLKERFLPKLEKGENLKLLKTIPSQNSTTPPPRYNEASLVKTLETKGIGRPSTYAPIISLIQIRGYVEKREGAFWPTPVGEAVIQFLTTGFDNIVDIPFTAQMEEDLDAIARGEKKWVPVLKDFYTPFEKKVESVAKTAKRVKIEVEKTGKKCPKCGKGDVVIRSGRFGKFLSCSRFPECDWKDQYQEKVGGIKCPECGAAIVLRRTRKGKFFYGCSRWPACKWASWRKPQKT
jgi:DNA topoisomerase-1